MAKKKTLNRRGGAPSSSKLLELLQNCSPALFKGVSDGSSLMAAMSCFKFYEGRVSAYNDEIYISSPMPAGLDLSAGVDGKTLLSVLSLLPNSPVNLRVEDEMMKLDCGKTKLKMPTIPIESFLNLEVTEKNKGEFTLAGEQVVAFKTALEKALVCIAPNCIQPDFRGAWIWVTEDKWQVLSSDGWCIGQIDIGGKKIPSHSKKASVEKFFIPLSLIDALLSFLKTASGAMKLSVSKSWVHITVDDVIFYGRQVSPSARIDTLPALIEEHTTEVGDGMVKVPSEMSALLKLAAAVAEEKGQRTFVFFDIEGDVMKLYAGDEAVVGKVEHNELPFESHTERRGGFDPELFVASLRHSKEVGFSSRAGVLAGDDYRCVFALIGHPDDSQ